MLVEKCLFADSLIGTIIQDDSKRERSNTLYVSSLSKKNQKKKILNQES